MFFKTCATLALATGFAAAKPVIAPHAPVDVPVYRRTAPVTPAKRGLDVFGIQNNFDFINQVDAFSQQQQIVNFQQEEVFFAENSNNFGRDQQQVIFAQAQKVVQIEQENNGGNLFFNDLSRKASFRNSNPGVETVVMVVKQIDISIDDGRGNQIQQQVFAQSVVIANRGARETQAIMVFEATAINAQNVLDGFGGNGGGIAAPTGVAGVAGFGASGVSAPQQTADVQFFGEKPTWSSIAEDPAATAAAAWQAELLDLNNVGNAQLNNDQNSQLVIQEQQILVEAVSQGKKL
ncbi:hypothetical protein BDV96DRAFT_595575 [Lophiotrema nucula]|uniref:Uncharacterized protein n=1 Tax=Lophiotrema nucula TaxID=690887 RepID=A0A6A5ZNZ6_9PLEO|nr:hypothetical protein BDV96DRAFT_595575 [Lophiotrema nucula]